MLERLGKMLSGREGSILSVAIPNGSVLALINLATLKAWLEIGLVGLTMAYTVWRWKRDSYVACEGCRQGIVPVVCPLATNRRPWWCPRRV